MRQDNEQIGSHATTPDGQQVSELREISQSSETGAEGAVVIAAVRFEHQSALNDTKGIGAARPRVSWTVATTLTDWRQAAYEVEAYDRRGQLTAHFERIESDESVLAPWPFAPLASRERLALRVRVWGVDGSRSKWSELAWVEAGLLRAEDWTAQFVAPAWPEDDEFPGPSPLLRHEFAVRPGITQARLYITALGVYEPYLNGQRVGDHVLAPGWTSYHHRLRYQTFDVTSLLREGDNAIGAMLGDGWYRGRLGFGGGRRNIYGADVALLAQLEITYSDGSVEQVVSDETWRAARGPILASDLYDGETYDARLEVRGWAEPDFDQRGWTAVRAIPWAMTTLVAPSGPPVRRVERVMPVAITSAPSGRVIVDFGQNLVGRVRFTVHGATGDIITLRHAEVLERGELSTRPLRLAAATDQYVLRGGGAETWEPRFTFHGFRYVEVEGWPGELRPDDVCAVVCHSDMERTGWFECSDPLLNRLHENVIWSMRGNFLDVPTDCPQRDERLGWTGDIQMFAPAASFLYDVAGFLESWLADLAAEQWPSGGIPFVVPDVLVIPAPPAAAWGDAAVIVPWALYQRYGDIGVLATQFTSMRHWNDLVTRTAGPGRLWNTGRQFGDWLDPSAPPEHPETGRTDKYLVATAYFAYTTGLLGAIAEALGMAELAEQYRAAAADIRASFRDEYMTASGRLTSDSETAYALALEFDLFANDAQRRRAGERLATLVQESGYHIATGFVGTPLICDALCHVGEYETAFRLLTQTECPSWLYPVTMGATTIWERWDSLLPDGSVNPGEMTSFNHYAFGAVVDWLHRTVAGLAPAAPGYHRITIAPHPGGGLTSARARHHTPYGLAQVSWRIEHGVITIEADVPPNTSARVALPGLEGDLGGGLDHDHTLSLEGDWFEVGSGHYSWSYPYRAPELARSALTVASTLQELLRVPTAYDAVLSVLARHLPHLARRIAEEADLRWNRDTPLTALCDLAPDPGTLRFELETALLPYRYLSSGSSDG
jgi:alpha-L-rhamnosidase